jgi:hypothetical protein
MNQRRSSRYAVLLVAAAMAAAGLSAAAPATALSAACHTGHAAGRAGGSPATVTGSRCGAGAAGRLNRAALAAVQHRGAVPWLIPGGHHVTAALPLGVAGVPEPGTGSVLTGVSCLAAGNCWAVGFYNPSASETELNEILHWNGATWSQVSAPNPGGTATGAVNQLFNVRCTAATNCWAVGNYTASGADLNQVLHWNGTKWSLAVSPDPGGTASGDISQLFDAVCRTAANCWAVGDDGSAISQLANQVLHWNGARWSPVATPEPGGTSANALNELFSIRCPASGTCLATGYYGTFASPAIIANQALLWNGTAWTQLTTPNPGGTTADGDTNALFGLGCTSASNCWAAGTWGTSAGTFNEALHWNGATWSLVSTPDPGGVGEALNQLNAVTCTAATNCWAVGFAGTDTLNLLTQALHWDGGTWSQVSTPDPAGRSNVENELESVRCTSASNCWTVGFAANLSVPVLGGMAFHWDGSTWSAG